MQTTNTTIGIDGAPARKTRVFMNTPAVTSRTGGPLRWKAQLISRGGGTEMYTSRPCATREEAEAQALRFLATPRGGRLTLEG